MVNIAELSEAQLADVNARLGKIVSETGWARTMAIGQILTDGIFNGCAGALSGHRKAWKDGSLRQLAARSDCPLRKTALAEAIAVCAVVNKERDLRSLAGISPSHVALVVHAEPELRRALLIEAAEARWSVRALHARLKQIRPSRPSQAASSDLLQGRRAVVAYKKSVPHLRDGLNILMTTKILEKQVELDISSLAREIAMLVQQTSAAMKAVSGSFVQPETTAREAQRPASAA